MKLDIVHDKKDLSKYFYVTYDVESSNSVYDAAWNICLGQSIGNPSARSVWETQELIDNYCAIMIKNPAFSEKSGVVEIGYPLANIDFDTDGISQLLCIIMGGQVDINSILRCRALKIEIDPTIIDKHFKKPKYGLSGIRQKRNQYNKPLFGSILKPKTGINPTTLLDMTKALVDGGSDFIKEDEILSNPHFCRLEDRVEMISKYISGTDVTYTFCINSDPLHVLDRAKFVADNGGTGIHVNVWSGLGVYKSIRDLDLPLFLHFQKSGDRVFTDVKNPFSLSWQLICQIASWSGVDSIHAGMWGGYLSDSEQELRQTLDILVSRNVVPALSCGMTAELVQPIADKFGVDWMANVGGAVHSHPQGTTAGALKMRQATDAVIIK